MMASGTINSWEIDAEMWKQCQTLFIISGFFFFFLSSKSLQMVIAGMKLKDGYSLERKL